MDASTASPIIVIAGPTASGKSAAAIDAAEALDGTVINADSMQIYADLRIVTARPSAADEARVPHRLFGVLPGTSPCSAGAWCDMALAEIALAQQQGRRPIVVGGTGLYLKALLEGLNQIPPVPDHIRQATRELFDTLGNEAFHDQLKRWDPKMANRLPAADSQRMIRAWEVMAATNRSLADWQVEAQTGPPPGMRFALLVLSPERQALYAACDARLDAMVDAGAVDEVRDLVSRGLPGDLPIMKTVGVPDLAAHVRGEVSLDAALSAAKAATRRYAKRQVTWLRHQLPPGRPDWPESVHACHAIDAQYSETLGPEMFAFLRNLR